MLFWETIHRLHVGSNEHVDVMAFEGEQSIDQYTTELTKHVGSN
jgi:hypothetical protein